MKPPEDKSPPTLIPPHGGYADLKSVQMTELVFDSTVVFCDRFIDRRSRTMIRSCRRRDTESRTLPNTAWLPAVAVRLP